MRVVPIEVTGPRRLAGDDFAAWAGHAATPLLRYAHALTGRGADAEDLTQETLVRVGLAWARLEPERDPMPYARRTLLNIFLNERRRAARWRSVAPRVAVPDQAPEPGSPDAAESRALLALLPPRQRAVIAMRYLLDLDDATIATELGCGEAAVRSNASRGLATLREHLARTAPHGKEPTP
ncbi:MAG TPA: sigma-70 family RNA polymerase sigma factor [Ornithinibacter sp.]|nr:sigma-70 family RNA polymerase sigma factor [Ornithinibacter sp.]